MTTAVPPVFEKSVVASRATLFKMKSRKLTFPVGVGTMDMGKVTLCLHSPGNCDDRYFFSGTGTDEPLGIINSGAALTLLRAYTGMVTHRDIVGMMLMLYFDDYSTPTWFISDGWKDKLDIDNLRMHRYPIVYTDSLPEPGQTGDLILADFRYYLIGFNADNPLEFDGAPRMSRPIEKEFGYRESPFVILGELRR